MYTKRKNSAESGFLLTVVLYCAVSGLTLLSTHVGLFLFGPGSLGWRMTDDVRCIDDKCTLVLLDFLFSLRFWPVFFTFSLFWAHSVCRKGSVTHTHIAEPTRKRAREYTSGTWCFWDVLISLFPWIGPWFHLSTSPSILSHLPHFLSFPSSTRLQSPLSLHVFTHHPLFFLFFFHLQLQ